MRIAIVLMLLAARSTAGDPSGSDYFEYRLPADATAAERNQAQTDLDTLERLRVGIDGWLVEAGILAVKKAQRKPKGPKRWLVERFRSVEALRQRLAGTIANADAIKTSWFLSGPEFRRPVLALAPASSAPKDARLVREQGGALILWHRLGFTTNPRGVDKGVPLLRGLAAYLRESPGFPKVVGGCHPGTVGRMRERVHAKTFPTVATLFQTETRMFNRDRDAYEYPAALLVEYLLESNDVEPKRFWTLMRGYGKRGLQSDGRREWKDFLRAYGRDLGKPATIDERLRDWVLTKSEAKNRAKSSTD